MPKRRPDDVVHVVMTDHYIRRPSTGTRSTRSPRTRSHHDPYRGAVVPYYPPEPVATPENDLLIAVAQGKSGSNLETGIRELKQAIEKHSPPGAYYYAELGEAYERAGRIADAIATYRTAREREPAHQITLQSLGRLLAQNGDPEAAAILQQALRQTPNNYQLHSDLGLAYLRLGDLSSALRELRSAIRINPDVPQTHNTLGTALIQDRDPQGAENAFRQAVRLKPDYANAHTNPGQPSRRHTATRPGPVPLPRSAAPSTPIPSKRTTTTAVCWLPSNGTRPPNNTYRRPSS